MASLQSHTRCGDSTSAALGAAPRSARPLRRASNAAAVPQRWTTPVPVAATPSRALLRRAAAPDAEGAPAAPAADAAPETVFYEGSGSNADLVVSLLLGATLVYLPLTMAVVGRRLWISYKFTNRRVIVETNSPVLKRTVEVPYDKIREIRTVPRAFGLWGDCVIFLKDGARLELVGLERFDEIRDYVEGFITDS